MMVDLIELRRLLHSRPELASEEKNTSQLIQQSLEGYAPDDLITGLGGFGLAAVFSGTENGPRVMIRCELDGLPIPETIELPYGSSESGKAHKCGHDGHMAIVVGLAEELHKCPPAAGSVVLLFQPAEETGEGAGRVIEDRKYERIRPDYAFALHNLPGFPLREVVLCSGLFASASTGLAVHLHGQTSHAAEPDAGKSPAMAVAQLIEGLSSLPQFRTPLHRPAQVTVIHAKVGEEAFGTSPGEGSVMATLRSHSQEVMDVLVHEAKSLSRRMAEAYGLSVDVSCTQVFPPTVNHPEAANVVERAARELGMSIREITIPFAWSEDFGHFTSGSKGALFGLGAGENHPVIHHPEYDFPEELLEPGVNLLTGIVRTLLG